MYTKLSCAIKEATDILCDMVVTVKSEPGKHKGMSQELQGGYYLEVGVRDMIFLRKHDTQRAFGNTFGECSPSCIAYVLYNYILQLEEDGYIKNEEEQTKS